MDIYDVTVTYVSAGSLTSVAYSKGELKTLVTEFLENPHAVTIQINKQGARP